MEKDNIATINAMRDLVNDIDKDIVKDGRNLNKAAQSRIRINCVKLMKLSKELKAMYKKEYEK